MANSNATARSKTYVDCESAGPDSHITLFRGIEAGVIVALIFFWLPFVIIYYLFGWLYLLGYIVGLVVVFFAVGLISRFYRSYGLLFI
jgi:hypothetical protein